ncbi:MAG TPA: CoA transferase [Xanthobacteraceae bacterium]|nr:CoA transferase [Xanthobacteraceae bacterium]
MKNKRASEGPLAGLKVIDLTSVVMGPVTTQILADYGADVVKIEPLEGDVMRLAGPMRSPAMGAMFMHANKGKRSLGLDVKNPKGRAALLKLCADADIFIHNIRGAAMQRLGFGFEEIRAVKRDIVYVSLIGYAEGGPYSSRPAYDDIIQGAVGIPSICATVTGSEPAYVPLTMVDRVCGISAAHAVLAAIIYRDRTGNGQSIELPMFETMAHFVLGDHMGGRTFEPPLGPTGYSRLLARERKPYRTKDSYVCVMVYSDKQWKSFFASIGDGPWQARAQHFAPHAVRAKNYDEVYQLLGEIFTQRTTAEWLKILFASDIPHSPLHTIDSLIDDEHLAAVGFFHEVDHPTEGSMRLADVPARWSESQPQRLTNPPRIGEHSVALLRQLGLDEEEINALCAEQVIVDGSSPAIG